MSLQCLTRLADKVVIITGAAGGIGLASAVEFANLGARLCLIDKKPDRCADTVQACKAAGLQYDKILAFSSDIEDEESLSSAVRTTIETFHGIDVIVNNAGYGVLSGLEKTQNEDFTKMFSVHVQSPFLLTQLALPHLKKSKGAVVNISSVRGSSPIKGFATYGIAKAAQDHLTRTMAKEFGQYGVRVNGIAVGVVRTGFLSNCGVVSTAGEENQIFDKSGVLQVLEGRCGRPEEIARTIVFLASDMSSFITGHILTADGGYTLNLKERDL